MSLLIKSCCFHGLSVRAEGAPALKTPEDTAAWPLYSCPDTWKHDELLSPNFIAVVVNNFSSTWQRYSFDPRLQNMRWDFSSIILKSSNLLKFHTHTHLQHNSVEPNHTQPQHSRQTSWARAAFTDSFFVNTTRRIFISFSSLSCKQCLELHWLIQLSDVICVSLELLVLAREMDIFFIQWQQHSAGAWKGPPNPLLNPGPWSLDQLFRLQPV